MTKKLLGDSRQEQFEIVVRGIAAQGWQRSVKHSGEDYSVCVYRGPVGKCALGHLIPDDAYDPEFDVNYGTPRVLEEFGIERPVHSEETFDCDFMFYHNLQRAHDGASVSDGNYLSYRRDTYSMQERLVLFAKDYGLTLPDELLPYANTVRNYSEE